MKDKLLFDAQSKTHNYTKAEQIANEILKEHGFLFEKPKMKNKDK